MASLRTIEWALVLGGLVFLQVGCASQGTNDVSAPADEVLVSAPPGESPAAAQSPQLTTEELDQLVAPIALYPDELVAQILAASTYPTEVVEADRWLQEHPAVKGATLAQSIDQQSWDPSIKALAQFPSVLAMMDKDLSWTSALGEAYVHEAQDVMDAVQAMRGRAQQAGNLKSTPQENVTTSGGSIAIEPADPEVVYVPEYDPWVIYGEPLALYPGWVGVPGVYYDGPGVYFGLGVGIGLSGGFAWGWHHWEPDWHHHDVMFDHHPFVSHSPSFVNHGFGRASVGHALTPAAPARRGAFGGFDHGGVVGAYSARGRASLGGGFHGGGFAGGFHGGGFHGGGSHR